jgi:hypothetical protein
MTHLFSDSAARAAVALAIAVGAVLATAPATQAATCTLYAEQPYYNGAINGWGHWWNCPSTAKVTIVLRQDIRWWPDRTLDSDVGYGGSGSLLVGRACGNHFDPIKVFVEVRYGSQKVQSPRAILPCG